MTSGKARHQVIRALLEAQEPLTQAELLARCAAPERDVRSALAELVRGGQVVEVRPRAGKAGRQYRWAARWAEQSGLAAAGARKQLTQIVAPDDVLPPGKVEIDSRPVRAFHEYIIHKYAPPADKRFCVFFQCSVRRPFSKSPSHGSMRRAVAVATGLDPARNFDRCPVHVVVLASRVGPVPYELEDVYPANARSGGVKHFREEHYQRVRPILAERMAEYITAHASSYDRMASFTDGRYGEVMRDARRIARADFPIFPDPAGPEVLRMGKSTPRTYWQKFWIQLYLEIVRWLDGPAQRQAGERLSKLKVSYR